jgi:hypothetical protein
LDVEEKVLDAAVERLKRDACKGDSEVAMVMKIEGSKSRLC